MIIISGKSMIVFCFYYVKRKKRNEKEKWDVWTVMAQKSSITLFAKSLSKSTSDCNLSNFRFSYFTWHDFISNCTIGSETIQIFLFIAFSFYVTHNGRMHITYGWEPTTVNERMTIREREEENKTDNWNSIKDWASKITLVQLNMENYELNRWSSSNSFAIGSHLHITIHDMCSVAHVSPVFRVPCAVW